MPGAHTSLLQSIPEAPGVAAPRGTCGIGGLSRNNVARWRLARVVGLVCPADAGSLCVDGGRTVCGYASVARQQLARAKRLARPTIPRQCGRDGARTPEKRSAVSAWSFSVFARSFLILWLVLFRYRPVLFFLLFFPGQMLLFCFVVFVWRAPFLVGAWIFLAFSRTVRRTLSHRRSRKHPPAR